MKKILFDLSRTQPVGNVKHHGGGKYGLAVFERIVSLFPNNIAVYYDDTRYIDNYAKRIINDYGLTVYFKRNISLYDAARNESCIVYCCLFDSRYEPLPPKDITLIQTQHGLRVLEMPKDEYQDSYTNNKRLFIRSTLHRIKEKFFSPEREVSKSLNKMFRQNNIKHITVSYHSKASLLVFFPKLDPNAIKVFYSPSTITHLNTSSENQYGKFYLLVSGNRWIKNNIRAIRALDELFTEHSNMEGSVVITGLSSCNEIQYKIRNQKRFHFIGYVEEKELVSLYKNAYLFIYPSLNEGFGYPPLEAMSNGCPVISSAIASIPEVCDNAVLYFNPYSIPEIKMRILQMEDEPLRLNYIQKGYSRQIEIEKKQEEDLTALCHFIMSFVK